jgi:hypothetical protein
MMNLEIIFQSLMACVSGVSGEWVWVRGTDDSYHAPVASVNEDNVVNSVLSSLPKTIQKDTALNGQAV